MELTRIKQVLALVGAALAIAAGASLLLIAALFVVRAGTGADPADAFTPTEVVPESLRGVVTWSPDAADLDRAMEPTTRRALEGAWLGAAATREMESAVPETAIAHELHVGFYSLDGQIVGLSGHRVVTRDVGGSDVTVRESHDSVLVLRDGRWVIDRLVITGAILTNP